MKITLTLFIILSFILYSNAQCPPSGITITTQAELNAFAVNYPNCTETEEYIQLYGSNSDPIIDLTPLENLTSIGSLVLNSIQSNNLEGLNSLNSVHSLTVYTNPNLTSLQGLDNLQNVFSLTIYGNNSLLSFSGLRADFNVDYEISIEGNPLLNSVTGIRNSPQPDFMHLSIINNPSLLTLDGFHHLIYMYDLTIKNNDALTSLNGLNNIEYVDNYIEISENDMLMSLQGLNSLVAVGDQDDGSLAIKDNQNLLSTSGLQSLQGAHSITLKNNALIQSLEGFNSVQVVLTDFTIEENNSLESLIGLENLGYVKTFKILNNNSLISTQGLQALESVQTFEIEGNGSLTTMAGIENLETALFLKIRNNNSLTELPEININNDYWFLTISDNSNLISLFNLESIHMLKGVSIINNASLTSLDGLGSINPTTLTQLTLKDNSQLENCHLPNICSYLGETNGESSEIENNFGNCETLQDVFDTCGIEMGIEEELDLETIIYTQNNRIYIKSSVEIKNLTIYDLSGKIIHQENEISSKEFEHALFSKGVFIVKTINSKGETFTKKVLL